MRTNFYESGEKTGKLLSKQQKGASFVIPAIKNGSGEVMTGKNDMNNLFCDFDLTLYKSECNLDPAKLNAFFQR